LVDEAIGYIGIGYTFGWISSFVFGAHYGSIFGSKKHKLFIMGTNDQFTSVAQLKSKMVGTVNTRIELVEGVDHFQFESPQYAMQTAKYIYEFIENIGRRG
jgi:hypothetical protein